MTANVVPGALHSMCSLAMAGDADAAAEVNAGIACLHRDLFLEANPIPGKWALKEMGKIGLGIRLPLVELDLACHEQLRQSLRDAGAL